MMKKLFTIILMSFITLCFAQNKDYKLLTTDKYNLKWYYSFDKKTSDGFYSWLKKEETMKSDPTTESTEYYIEFKCSNKTMSDEIVINNWRNDKPEVHKNKFPFQPISSSQIAWPLVQKYCK